MGDRGRRRINHSGHPEGGGHKPVSAVRPLAFPALLLLLCPPHGFLYRASGQLGIVFPDDGLHLPAGLFHLVPQVLGGETEGAVAQNDELLGGVRGGHSDPAPLSGKLIAGLFDIAVGRLGLFGVDHMDVVILFHRAGALGDLVGVKNQNDPVFPVALIVAEDVHQPFSGSVHVVLRHGFQLLPGEDDVIAKARKDAQNRGRNGGNQGYSYDYNYGYGGSDASLQIAGLENSLFGQTYSYDPMAVRLNRLERRIFQRDFASDDGYSRIERLHAASKAKKTAKYYDNNKFQKFAATGMQLGTFVLMILALLL